MYFVDQKTNNGELVKASLFLLKEIWNLYFVGQKTNNGEADIPNMAEVGAL